MSTAGRRVGIALGWLVLLVVVIVGAVYALSEQRANTKVMIAAESIVIPTDSESIARGRHLARAISKCTVCHGEDLAGQVMVDAPPMGRWVSLNLTRGAGGVGGQLKDEDWIRAIRHGVAPDGRKLKMMPSVEYVHLSAEDLGAIIAYVKSVPPVDKVPLPSTLGPVARALLALNKLPLYDADAVDHSLAPTPAIPVAATMEYGHYLANVGGCTGCHGPGLSGGKIPTGPPDWPAAANLTPAGIGSRYTEEKFFKALREGVKPEGVAINPVMPIGSTKEMTDDEIRAVYMYLKTVPPKAFGGR
ncbi:MAG TPA: cytochrome c [Gemmatimonadaceae bacterium]|nr:cytochrome c [Gemmatimonadaceae bacterium]